MGVVQAGKSRSVPETSTRQIRQAPTAVRPSRSHNVGMYLPLALAACRMVWPSSALISSPSIRIDNFFCGKVELLSARVAYVTRLAHVHGGHVTPQTTAGLIQSLFLTQAGYHFVLRTRTNTSRKRMSCVTAVRTWFFRRRLLVLKPRVWSVPAGSFLYI